MDIWEQANALHLARDFDEAEKLYDKLLTQNPDNSGLLATLGTLYLQKEKTGLAICLLEHALKLGLNSSEVLSNLALAYQFSGQRQKAMKFFEESVKDSPSGETLANYSALFVEAGEDEKCKAICKRAIDLSPEHPLSHWNLSLALLGNGQWETAWDEHEWGLKPGGLRVDRPLGGVPMWDGKAPGTVAVYGEQGIGDEIMFASMLPDVLKTNNIVLECHTRLKTLFEKSFHGVVCHGTREDKEPKWAEEGGFDYRIPIGSLGKFYRRSREAFPGTPYLKADASPKGSKFRVGISWTGGGAKQGRVQKRSVPLSWWKQILDAPNVEFASLQYTEAQNELSMLSALGYDIKYCPEVHDEDYYETAKLVASCDLIITVCTSVVHLAGALGVPCWVMTPKFPAWRYQNSGGMPWYRSVRLYRSPDVAQHAWKPVIERVGNDLERLVSGKSKIQRVA